MVKNKTRFNAETTGTKGTSERTTRQQPSMSQAQIKRSEQCYLLARPVCNVLMQATGWEEQKVMK